MLFNLSRGRWVALFALLSLALVGCGRRAVPLNTTLPVALEAQADPTELRAAIIRGLEARHFVAESEQPGRIIGRLSHRGRGRRGIAGQQLREEAGVLFSVHAEP